MSCENSESMLVTIRLIRSFAHRNIRNLVIHGVRKNMSVNDLKLLVAEELKKSSLPPPFKSYNYDTMKIEHVPFKSKSSDPVINCLDDDMLILSDNQLLSDSHIINETEISYFVRQEYEEYKESKNKLTN